MPNISAWMGDSMPLGDWTDDWNRSVDTARLISDKPTTITVTPVDGREVDPQVVRIEALSEFAQAQIGTGGNAATLRVIVIGYRGHESIDDTDLKRGDRFVADGTLFEVILIQPGHSVRLMAIAEARN
jgi:hypothetical protein